MKVKTWTCNRESKEKKLRAIRRKEREENKISNTEGKKVAGGGKVEVQGGREKRGSERSVSHHEPSQCFQDHLSDTVIQASHALEPTT